MIFFINLELFFMVFLNIYIERQHANKKVLLKKHVKKHVLPEEKNIQNKYYTLFLRYNQVLVLVETPISLMVLFLHINICNISSLY